jgi:hypothetical protein
MTETNFNALDDTLKDEIRRAFEACASQIEYDELHKQIVDYSKHHHENAWKLLKQQIKDHFHEYDLTFSDRRIIISTYRVEYSIDSNGEWSLYDVSTDECTHSSDLEELASRAQSVEDDIESGDILDTIRQYFNVCPSR